MSATSTARRTETQSSGSGNDMNSGTEVRAPKQRGVGRLVRRLERERRQWARSGEREIPTEQAWRAGVAEGIRLAQVAIRKGV